MEIGFELKKKYTAFALFTCARGTFSILYCDNVITTSNQQILLRCPLDHKQCGAAGQVLAEWAQAYYCGEGAADLCPQRRCIQYVQRCKMGCCRMLF